MTLIPNIEAAVITQSKIVDYLLNPQHPEGSGKAIFFLSLGFQRDDWKALAEALRESAERSPLADRVDSIHGEKYIVEGTIATPVGRVVGVRTVWIVDRGETAPRLVTAYSRPQDEVP